jgi:exodeoxyribonuclease-5
VFTDVSATLTKPMRYNEDSHLYGVEQIVRYYPRDCLASPTLYTPSAELAVTRNYQGLVQDYITRYREDPSALHRMFLFQRKAVVDANNRIREALFGADAGVVVEDERLMILATSDYPAGLPREDGGVRYYSGQHFRVLDVEETRYHTVINGADFDIPCYQVQFDNGERPVRIMFSVDENRADNSTVSGAAYSAAMAAARNYGLETGDWKPFIRMKNDFVQVGYTYATTVHRAQGQTCDYAYCAPRQLQGVKGIMGEALTYVAMTRARRHVSIVY